MIYRGCPSNAELTGFSTGELDVIRTAAISTHIEHCPHCLLQLQECQVHDPLLSMLRQASPDAFSDEETCRLTRMRIGDLGSRPESTDDRDRASQATEDRRGTRGQGVRISPDRSVSLSAGQTVGPYKIVSLIARGGMGHVYDAIHVAMRRRVALKIVRPDLIDDANAVRRFQRETQAVGKLDHPNIVTAFDAGEADGVCYLAMEWIAGEDLGRIVRRQGALPAEQVIPYIVQAARGLGYAHDHGVVHRDVKPANLMVVHSTESEQAGTIKILDLGLAQLRAGATLRETADDRELTTEANFIGSIDYMSPEQAEDGRNADYRSDIYSLGCTLYRLLTGRHIYGETTPMGMVIRHREKEIPSLRDALPAVPDYVEDTFRRMVAKSPEDRPQSMQEVIEGLTDLEQRSRSRFSWTTKGIALGLASLLIGMVVIQLITPKGEIVIRSHVPGLELKIVREDEVVGRWTAGRSSEATWYRTGEYRIVIAGDAGHERSTEEIRIANQRFELTRGDRVIVEIETASKDGHHNRIAETAQRDSPIVGSTEAERNRELIRWIVAQGGMAEIVTDGGKTFEIRTEQALPDAAFHIRHIKLRHRRDVNDESLVRVKGLKHLIRLDIAKTSVTGSGLVHLSECEHLEEIDLSSLQLESDALSHLAPLTNLRDLQLASSATTDAIISHLPEMPSLEVLSVRSTLISNTGLDHIVKQANLKTLILSLTSIDDQGVPKLAALRQLESLNLGFCRGVTDKSVPALVKLPATNLVISGTSITDQGLKPFVQSKNLKTLQVGGPGIKNPTIESLRGALPTCRIINLREE